jgi:hypothetical protein
MEEGEEIVEVPPREKEPCVTKRRIRWTLIIFAILGFLLCLLIIFIVGLLEKCSHKDACPVQLHVFQFESG